MPETPLLPQSPLQQQIVQMALELAIKLEAQANQAAFGKTLADCEALLLDHGRQFLRDSLAATLQQQIQQAEKKGAPRATVLADTTAATRASALGKS
jgi:hypothetical protein